MANRTGSKRSKYRVTVITYRDADSAQSAEDAVYAELHGRDFHVREGSAVAALTTSGYDLPGPTPDLCGRIHEERRVYDGTRWRVEVVAI